MQLCLALALWEHFGLPIYGLGQVGQIPVHYASRLGDFYIDITGIRDASAFKENAVTELDALGELGANKVDQSGEAGDPVNLFRVPPSALDNPDYSRDITPANLEKATGTAVAIMRKLHDLELWPPGAAYENPDIRLLASIPEVSRAFLLSQRSLSEELPHLFPAWRYADGEEEMVKILKEARLPCKPLSRVLETYALMSKLRVTVPIYLYGDLDADTGFVIMKKADVSFCEVVLDGKESGASLNDKVRRKVQLMHDNDIAHGDLHGRNIVCMNVAGSREKRVYIIDFEASFHISRGGFASG